jgi:uncharacterized protein (TIGR00297 family)
VLANGGIAALLSLVHQAYPSVLWWGAFVGSLAAATADTWATELGVLAKKPPRLVTTGAAVPPGTSGGVSLLGTAATVGGSASIGLAASLLMATSSLAGNSLPDAGAWSAVLPALLGGVIGAFTDSMMGATVQAVYYTRQRQKETEKRRELDGTPNEHLRGWPWITNDVVNLSATAVGALAGGLTVAWLG